LDAGDAADAVAAVPLRQPADQPLERPPVGEERRDVAKEDPGLGIVGNAPDQPRKIDHSTLPATLDSRATTAASRAVGAVMIAPSSARSQPRGHGTGRPASFGIVAPTSRRAASAFRRATATT